MSEPRRLHPVAAVMIMIRFIRQGAIPVFLPLAVTFFQRDLDRVGLVFLLGAVFVLMILATLAALWAYISWRRFTYRVENNELRLEQGVIFRSQRTIPRERIQAIDLVEGVLHRVFGVVAVRVQTAGTGSGPEVSLSAISREAADELRNTLSIESTVPASDEAESSDETAGSDAAMEQRRRRLTPAQLAVAATTSGGIGIAIPVVASGLSIVNNALPENLVFDTLSRIAGSGPLFGIIIGVLVIAWVLSFVGTVLAHFNFTITRSEDNLLIERGLLERRRATVPLTRIQAIRIVDGILRQPLGYTMLRVESAGYGRDAGESTVLFPMIRRDDVPEFLGSLVPEFAVAPDLSVLPARSRRRYMTKLIVFAAIVVGIVLFASQWFGLELLGFAAAVLIPLAAVLGWLRYRDAGWALTDEVMVLRYRFLARTTTIVPRRRIQYAEVTSNPLQERADLATFSVSVASGLSGASFSLLHVDREVAAELLNWSGPVTAGREVRQIPHQLIPSHISGNQHVQP